MEGKQVDIELLQTQLKFTLWFIGILMTALTFFIVRAFGTQTKKDEKQDAQLEKLNELMDKIGDAIHSIDTTTQVQSQVLKEHEKHILKHDAILEEIVRTTRGKK
jgi:Tfp pilus assembly protein PilN